MMIARLFEVILVVYYCRQNRLSLLEVAYGLYVMAKPNLIIGLWIAQASRSQFYTHVINAMYECC